MNNQTLMIILVIVFFMLNCKISCKKNIENFSSCSSCVDNSINSISDEEATEICNYFNENIRGKNLDTDGEEIANELNSLEICQNECKNEELSEKELEEGLRYMYDTLETSC